MVPPRLHPISETGAPSCRSEIVRIASGMMSSTQASKPIPRSEYRMVP